jgi:glutaryl-CoA dehydrogenase
VTGTLDFIFSGEGACHRHQTLTKAESMDEFRGVDFFKIEELLSEEERMARNTARSFVEEQVLPIIERHFENATFPMELVAQMAQLGFFGANLPQEYDCAGLNNVAYGLILQELERGDSGLRSFASVQGALVMYPIYAFGSEEQRRTWLPKLANGEKIGCFGLTEPDHGSDPGSMITRAVRSGSGWILNGAKSWITNGTIADIAVVWAKAEGQVRGFLVEKGTKGFTAPEIGHKISLRASVTSQLILEDCAIPEENLLPGSGGLKSPFMCLNQARYGIAWGALGAAMACYHAAVQYAKERKQFDRPIGGFQLVQEKLVYMLSEITKGQLLALQLGRLKDAGRMHHAQTSLAKRNNVAIALETARLARDILGANGISLEFPVIRHMCNLEAVKTYEGTHDIHTLILGEAITGISAIT